MGLRASGEDFPIEATLSRVEIQGEPHCTLVLRDVSDRKRFEDALRQSEALYRSLFESLEEGVTLWDAEGRIEACNPAAERILGWPAHALGGLHYSEVPWRSMAADQTVFDLESLAAAIIQRSGNPILHRERRVIRADGKEMWTLQNGIPLHSGAPNTRPRVMITFVDITDRKAAEQALRERDAAEEASRLKSEFLATMSHELRTPLTGVIGFAEYLRAGQAGPVNDEQAECLDSVHKSSLNLLNLINAILDLSKIEAGKMELSPETFDVSEAVEEARNMISPMTNEKRIQLLIQVDPALSSVTLDRTKFVQVLYNLMSNGVKFTDAPGRVEVGVDVPEDRRIRIRVTDTGIGIDTRDLDKLFRNFHQLDGGDARRHEGTGLGLALTKKIVELQQGVIAVDSTPGQGSVFTVTLPH
jgi:protein-histidine pros-kinase